MKSLFLILLYSILSKSLVAQGITFEHPVEKTMGYGLNIFVGGQFSNFNELNTILKEEGTPEVNPNFMLIGGGMNLIYGSHFLHLKGNAALNEKRKDIANKRTSTRGFGVGINYGYKF